MDKSYNFLVNNNLFNEGDYVVVAVSGGPDSMALLHLLLNIREKIKINIVCAHVNHNKRKESDDEKVFVEEYCKSNNVYFEYMKIEEYGSGNFHSEARDIRYSFFKEVMKKYNSHLLFTAHHGDDLIETILMRIVRGSNLKGYSGFSKITDLGSYKIVRPLIFYTKSEILEYDILNKIPYVIDSSNNEDDYTRNRYRHVVLPFLKNEDANVHEKFLNFSEILSEYDSFFDSYLSSKQFYDNGIIDVNLFLGEDELIQRRIIESVLRNVYKDDLSLVNSHHVTLISNLIKNDKPNVSIELPGGFSAVKEYDKVSFKKNSSINYDYDVLLERVTLLPNGRTIYFVDNEDGNGNDVCRLDSNELKLPLHVRNKKNGDKIFVKNLNGSKKVKDIFIEKKVSFDERRLWPVVVDSENNVVWIPGLKKSKYNKEKNEKCDIIVKYR